MTCMILSPSVHSRGDMIFSLLIIIVKSFSMLKVTSVKIEAGLEKKLRRASLWMPWRYYVCLQRRFYTTTVPV